MLYVSCCTNPPVSQHYLEVSDPMGVNWVWWSFLGQFFPRLQLSGICVHDKLGIFWINRLISLLQEPIHFWMQFTQGLMVFSWNCIW